MNRCAILQRATASTPYAAVKRQHLPSRHLPSAFCSNTRKLKLQARAISDKEVDIESEVEAFLKKQAEIESGAAFARSTSLDKVIGAELVSDETAKKYCRDIVEILKNLKRTRDMGMAEVKLVVSIEDPRARERRLLGMENDDGVSRDEMGAALMEVAEGRIPRDRLALKCLYDEISTWPLGNDIEEKPEEASPAEKSASYAELAGGTSVAQPYIFGKDARRGDKAQNLSDMLPDWVGYFTLYGISGLPVIFAAGAIIILFINALK